MNTESIFRIILPALLVAFVAHRGYYVQKHGKEENTLKKREDGLVIKLAGILALMGLISTLAYVINPNLLSWAFLPLPLWLRWPALVSRC